MSTLLTRDHCALGAAWECPPEPRGIALILPGSGNVNLHGDVSSPLLGTGYRGGRTDLNTQIAEALSSHQIASFRYSKRGVDDAEQLQHQCFPYLLNDAEDALMEMKRRYPQLPLVVVGFSEGALIASLLAATTKKMIDSLYLLGFPSRPIDEIIIYQFLRWPVDLLKKLDQDHDGILSQKDFSTFDGKLPLLGSDFSGLHWSVLDQDQDGLISISKDVLPVYEKAFENVMALLTGPVLGAWYESMISLPRFEEYASSIDCPVFLYHGKDDAQVAFDWILDDRKFLHHSTRLRFYEGLGHCFAPMDGCIGQIKTTGPLDQQMLQDLAQDFTGLRIARSLRSRGLTPETMNL